MKSIIKSIIIKILTIESKLVLKKYKPKIIAITGSVGKTSTKDAVYEAQSVFFHVRKTHKSYNSEIGIPLTILGCPNAWNSISLWLKNILTGLKLILLKNDYPEWLVLEVGADRPGDIEQIMTWVHPDVSIVTRIGKVPVHIEFYPSLNDVIKEKSNIVRALKKEGILILNADDEDVLSFKKYTNARVFTFGIKNEASVRGTFITPMYSDNKDILGISVKVDVAGNSIPVTIKGALGVQHIYPILASFALALAEEKNLLSVADAFKNYATPPGRMKLIEGVSNSVIIDDTYNASPTALEEAISEIKKLNVVGKKIAIIGDMLELGKHSKSEHERLGIIAREVFDLLVVVGIRAKDLGQKAIDSGMKAEDVIFVISGMEAVEAVKDKISKNDIVFVKGSQGMRMERVVEKIMAYPEKKKDLLVRQEEEWLKRL